MIGAVNHITGMTLGLGLIAVVWYLYFHDKCPPKHTVVTFAIGVAMVFLSSDIVFSVEAAARWDIIAHALLTLVGLMLALRGWTVELSHSIDVEDDLLPGEKQ